MNLPINQFSARKFGEELQICMDIGLIFAIGKLLKFGENSAILPVHQMLISPTNFLLFTVIYNT